MTYSLRTNAQDLIAFSKHWLWFLIWGIALIILGLYAISAATMTTMISIVVIGVLIAISGGVIMIDSFTAWRGKKTGFFIHLLMGILYLLVGLLFIQNPMFASTYLTLILGALYLVIGAFRLFYSLAMQPLNWGWNFFNGLITLLLGILILSSWPASSLFIIGLFVGIDLLVCGWVYTMVGLASRRYSA